MLAYDPGALLAEGFAVLTRPRIDVISPVGTAAAAPASQDGLDLFAAGRVMAAIRRVGDLAAEAAR